MPTQEERLTALEQAQVRFSESVSDLNHHVTMLIGTVQRQEWDIREIKGSLRSIDGRLGTFEQNVNIRFEALEGRFGPLEQSVSSRFEAQDKKLDQILLLLNASTPKPEQEI
jgi:peptidoglycan hydrolase CwlO-like protein